MALIPKKTTTPFQLGTDLNALNQQRSHTQTELGRRTGSAATPWSDRLKLIDEKIKSLTPTTTTTPAPTPTNTTTPQASENTMKMLFPDWNNFLPSTYEGSPLYQFQKREGLKNSDAFYASRGLTGSGAEIGGVNKFLSELGAKEADRAQNLANSSADRAATLMNNEADRRTAQSNEQFNRLYSILKLAADQNPLQYSTSGMNSYGSILEKIAGLEADNVRSNFKIVSGGGSGGGGVSVPSFIPPYPNSPDYSAADLARVQGNAQNNTSMTNILTNVLAGLLGGNK